MKSTGLNNKIDVWMDQQIEAQHEAEFHTRPTGGPRMIPQENRNLVFPVVVY